MTKQNQSKMVEESGIEPSLTEEDMKIYLEKVIAEVRKKHVQRQYVLLLHIIHRMQEIKICNKGNIVA